MRLAIGRLSSIVFVMSVLLMPSSFARPVQEPNYLGCVECSVDPNTGRGQCGDAAEYGDPSAWSICTGGVQCYVDGSGQEQCFPYCGQRCNWA